MINPIVDSMMLYFGMADSQNSTGYYSGALVTSGMLGRLVTSPLWGWASDHYGRKPCVLVNLLVIAVLSFVFAFAKNYWIALTCRFFIGCFACISICLRSSVTELTPKDFHAQANMYFSTGYNIGNLTGASVGGLFVNRSFGIELLEHYPYAMPSLICSALSLVILLLLLAFLKESYNPAEHRKSHDSTWEAYKSLTRNTEVMSYVNLMLFLTVISSSISSVYPTWCFADPKHGGLSFTPNELGLLITVTSSSAIVIQNVIYKRLLKRVGLIGSVILSTWVMFPNVLLMPYTTLFSYPIRVPFFVLGLLINSFCNFQINTAIFIMTGEAVDKSNKGKVNALVMIANTFARMICPICSTALFAWSANFNKFPIDFHLVFFISAIFSVITIRYAYVAASFYTKKKEPL
eukprot:CAMPEP_0204909258 /NCGR_PEP_ID=MMETSP1397-20131031/8017_1 /ASSEMBLY_ACC=CAM_ASM_000891 /TAXON_ID=49980 /ORGANISM="Climacostomum Climacostomum virens, Strain Stock W-24" /LENGTH=405 /DNA_ID=CAMNT_0052079031 /DNA_START=50 /DNA_END=1264 /DNA_ORIENTATION=-